jgi:seryl-tRNA synthetase
MQRCHYIQSFPHALTLTAHLREDLEAIMEFARTARIEDGRLACAFQHLAGVKCLLSPTICFHYYAWLQGTTLAMPRSITATGHCFRYESGALSSLERLWDFTMREIIFVGSQDYVLEHRERCVQAAAALLDEWGLSYEIRNATDPFFIDEYSAQSSFQTAFELKFEIRADLPYAAGKTLAVGSFNYHQDFFGRSLAIKQPEGGSAHTGCVGFGMERLALAFLSQYGLDPVRWPRKVREAF